MKLGISSYSYTWAIGVNGSIPSTPLNEIDLLHNAKALGIGVLQIADNMPIHNMTGDQQKNLHRQARDLNIELEVGANNMTPENLETYIGIAEKMQSRLLRFAFDGKDYRPSVNEAIAIIKNAEPELKKRNLILAIENHDRLLAGDFTRIIESVNSPFVGICLDCANSLGNGEGLKEVVGTLAPYTVNFHLKEVYIKRKYHKMGFDIEGKIFGEGCLPLEWMLEKIPSDCKTAILEQWTPPEETIEKTIEKENLWAAKSISYLKKYFN